MYQSQNVNRTRTRNSRMHPEIAEIWFNVLISKYMWNSKFDIRDGCHGAWRLSTRVRTEWGTARRRLPLSNIGPHGGIHDDHEGTSRIDCYICIWVSDSDSEIPYILPFYFSLTLMCSSSKSRIWLSCFCSTPSPGTSSEEYGTKQYQGAGNK